MISNRYLLIVITTTIGISLSVSAKVCDRPQICVPVDHCSGVDTMLYRDDLSRAERDQLSALQCGYFEEQVYVCCNSTLPQVGECAATFISLTEKIINGNLTELGQYPFAVLLGRRYKEPNGDTGIKYECGGSIISDRYVLTAAHCVQFLNKTSYIRYLKAIETVRLGEWDLATDPDYDNKTHGDPVVQALVEKIIPHKDYRSNKYNDIALLRLKEPIKFTKFIQPICLPNVNQDFGEYLTVIGWGATGLSARSRSQLTQIQRDATVNVVDDEDCNAMYDGYRVMPTQICAGTQGSDACSGDSGGPLVGIDATNPLKIYSYLAGVVSFGRSCAEKFPGIYTDVRKYLKWIEQNMIH